MSENQRHSQSNIFLRHLKIRLIITHTMLILGYCSIILLNLHHRSIWFFSQIMGGVYGLCCIGLHGYFRQVQAIKQDTSLWHQILHWIGFWIILYIMSLFVSSGFITSTQGGFLNITLLSFSVFIAGVYTDPALLLVGTTLCLYTVFCALSPNHISIKMIPITAIASLCLFILTQQQRRFMEKKAKGTQ